MPCLRLIIASGTAQRRVLEETIADLEKKEYALCGRQEGGEWISLLSDNMSGGLFNDKRLVVADSAELLGPLPPGLAGMVVPDAPVILLLVYSSEPGKLIPKEVLKKCEVIRAEGFPRWPRERQTWVTNLAGRMGLSVDRDAAALIVDLLDDPEEIRSQMLSLSMLKKDAPISRVDVEELCLDDGGGGLLKLLDSLCAGDAICAVRSLRTVSSRGELFPLLAALHNRVRLALYASSYPNDGAMFARALGARDYAWRQAGNAARRYGTKALLNFVVGLIKINVEEKSGRGAGWYALELLVLELLSSKK